MLKIINALEYKEIFPALERFVETYEKFCIALYEKILLKDKDVFVLIDGKILGVFYFAEGNSLICCIPKWTKEIKKVFSDFIKDKKIFCIHGEESQVIKLEKLIKWKYTKKETRNMFLMEYQGLVYIKNADLSPFICKMSDCEKLMPLQTGFSEEEVMPEWKKLNLPAERMKLDKAVKNKTVYALGDEDFIYSKANISLCANKVIQISGVYTKKEFRRKGYASFLVNRIAFVAGKVGCKATLLVRQENLAAYSAYKKAGFGITGTYKIVYYK